MTSASLAMYERQFVLQSERSSTEQHGVVTPLCTKNWIQFLFDISATLLQILGFFSLSEGIPG
jgi:hypothetical protein